MVVRDEEQILLRALESTVGLCDNVLVVDTGSVDGTREVASEFGADVVSRPWVNFGHNRTEALELAKDRAPWTLQLDADMVVEAHEDLRDWLAGDPDPDVTAWQVEIADGAALRYRLPQLVRAGLDWKIVGPVHEYLVPNGKQRPLLGLTLHHLHDGNRGGTKYEQDLVLLQPGYDEREPRATYYYAQTLWCLGRPEEASEVYRQRSLMTSSYEEERWHAQYMAARLVDDVKGLLAAHLSRPWRPEPLEWAARIVRGQGTREDGLFLESPPG
jgi:glycosyltransferase involved in cell wall biosynthesis